MREHATLFSSKVARPGGSPPSNAANDGVGKTPGSRIWMLFSGAGLFLAALYVLLPYGLTASAVYVVATLYAAVSVALAIVRRRLFCPVAWVLAASALGLAAIGHAIWYWLDLRGMEPFPSSADAFYLAVYPLFMAALWLIGRQREHDDGALVDALIVGVSAAVLGWAQLIAPYLNDADLTLLQLLVSAAYPVADLVLLPLLLRLVFLQRTRIRAHLLLLLGMLAYLAADVLYAHGNSANWYAPGGFTDSLWLIAYALITGAAWHPSARIEPHMHVSSADMSVRRLILLGAASMLAPMVILFAAGTDIEIVRVAAIASILLFLLVMHRMAGLVRQTHQQAQALDDLSRVDPLTGAANRRALERELVREMARAHRTGSALSLAFIDLDYFKQYNDTHGHSAGDDLLRTLTSAWRTTLRVQDILARFGGEEFVVVFPDADVTQSKTIVERLRSLVPHGQTCSAGLAAFQRGETPEAFIRRADQALYAAKNNGRDQVGLAKP